MRYDHAVPLMVALAVLALSACELVTPAAAPTAASTPIPMVTPMPAPQPIPHPPVVRAAVTELARRLGVPSQAIRIASVQEVVWADTAYGCPQPGRAYAQVLSPGIWIILEHQGERYDYRGSPTEVHLCPPERQEPPAAEGGGVT